MHASARSPRAGPLVLLGVLSMLLLATCTAPQERIHRSAERADMRAQTVMARGFRHRVYVSAAPTVAGGAASRLHVYVDGDGTPWRSKHQVAADPTPRRPVALHLMRLDPAPSIYVGRPCYHGFAGDPACSPLLWTYERYSETVVASMTAVIRQMLERQPPRAVVLIGHSGGGTLARLLAERIPETVVLITLAANLDVAAWTGHHGYTPLHGSMDPALRPPLPARVRQWHLYGGRDREVPSALVQRYVAKEPGARVSVLPGYDHHCCWAEHWPPKWLTALPTK